MSLPHGRPKEGSLPLRPNTSASFAALPAALRDALNSGMPIVTPNNRLARRIKALYDETQREQRQKVWSGASAMPWKAWLRTRWHDLVAIGEHARAHLLPPVATASLWQRVVTDDGLALMDRTGAAALAAEAWALMHAWGSGKESWRAWRMDGSSDDAAAFARWAEAYRLELARRDCIDDAMLADALVAALARHDLQSGADIDKDLCLAGFIEITPQQQRLLDALAENGIRITHCATVSTFPENVTRVHPATKHDEIIAALSWARNVVEVQPTARVAVVVEDLASRRAEVVALAYDVLAAGALLPGAEASALPFDLSLGEPLAAVPLAAAALALIGLVSGDSPMGEAAALLRSPYLPLSSGMHDAWIERARIERHWLEAGCKTIDLDAVILALRDVDPELARRWIEAKRQASLPSSATPREWIDRWRAWLQHCGWPGDRTLGSAEWQARQAWEDILTGFAGLAAVESRLSRHAAWSALRRMARDAVFQPEAGPAPIAIIGVLEAAGLPFDALWVAGLTADRWPAASAPNPFLPLSWQRERGVPRASPARELGYAQTLTKLLTRGAPQVVMSCARRDADAPLLPSALLLPFRERDVEALPLPYAACFATDGLEAIDDAMIPPLAPLTVARGGAHLIGQYADCPFQAVAHARLGADPWPAPLEGLSPLERGTLLHWALAEFWRVTRDHSSLLRLTPHLLASRLSKAAAHAHSALSEHRWQQIAPAVAAGETTRLIRIVSAWLEHERLRPPFAVEFIESDATLTIGGIVLRMRLDRVDRLEGGGVAIIDYKGGLVHNVARWFDAPLPFAPQLGLYALSHRALHPETPLRAVAYAQLRPDRLGAIGLAADAFAWPQLNGLGELNHALIARSGKMRNNGKPINAAPPTFLDWSSVEAWWHEHLGALASAYAAGNAEVAPRDAASCQQCKRQMLCRIGSTVRADDDMADLPVDSRANNE